jgi:predicted Fe-Mo cluster-binding NifX family protein
MTSEGLLRADESGLAGNRRTLIVAGLLAALALGAAALLAAGAPRWHAPTLATASEATAPSTASLAASRGVGSDQHAFWVARSPNGLVAVNGAQRMRAAFSAAGVQVAVPGGHVSLALSAVGRGTALQSATRVKPVARANRVSYVRRGLVEWYANGPLGLEQGVTLRAPPTAGAGSKSALSLSFELGGAAARLQGGQLVFHSAAGAPVLHYNGLSATDARGRLLPSRLQLHGHRLLIEVNDRGARYPITIDPLIQAATLTASDTSQGSQFGFRTAVSGSTLVVSGAGAFQGNAADSGAGALYVFTEPASGWANATQVAKLTASTTNPAQDLGASVAISGNTIYAIGNDAATGPDQFQGLVYVYAKPAGGWANMTETAVLSEPGNPQAYQTFTQVAVSPSAGGDTIFAGAPQAGTAAVNVPPGAVYVFTEPAGGWSPSASNEPDSAVLTPSDGGGYLGSYLAVSGQTLLAGAPYAGTAAAGAVYVFDEPAGWVSGTQTAELTAPDGSDGQLGYKVATDGSTIVAGAPFATIGATSLQGAAYVYTEPASGWATTATPAAELTASNGATHDLFGLRIAVGQFPTSATSSAPPSSQATVETIFVGTGDGHGVYAFAEPASGWQSAAGAAALGLTSASTYSLTLAGSYLLEGVDNSSYGTTPNLVDGQVNLFDTTGGGGGGGGAVPVATSPPTISGTPLPGHTLTAHPGSWTNQPTAFTYQWYLNGHAIAGATKSTYVVQIADEAGTLSVRVTATGAGGTGTGAGSVGALVAIKGTLHCPKPSGRLSGTSVGRLGLGMTQTEARHKLHRFAVTGNGFDDFCLYAGWGIRVGYPSARLLRSLPAGARGKLAKRIVLALTANPFYALDGARPGGELAAVARKLKVGKTFHIGLNDWYVAPGAAASTVLKVRHGIIQEIGLANKRLTKGRTAEGRFLSSFKAG